MVRSAGFSQIYHHFNYTLTVFKRLQDINMRNGKKEKNPHLDVSQRCDIHSISHSSICHSVVISTVYHTARYVAAL